MSNITPPQHLAHWFTVLAASTLFVAISSAGEGAGDPVSLIAAKQMQPSRVKAVLEVDGHLVPGPAKDGTMPSEPSLKAKGRFLYEERLPKGTAGEALRFYEEADAEISVDGRPRQLTLREDRRFIMCEANANAPEGDIRSLQGALTREELELIELPGGSHLINQLVAGRSVSIGESWSHEDSVLAPLLNLTAVTGNDVTSTLTAVDSSQQHADCAINGKIIGSVAGVLTEIQLQGKYRFDLQRARVTWIALSLREHRSAGLSKPGLRVKARLRLLVDETPPVHLISESLQEIMAGAPQPTELLEYEPADGQVTLMHDRRWHVFSEHAGLIVFRLIEDEQLVSQCNLRVLPPQNAGDEVSMPDFQNEIRTALGKAAQQIVDSQESTNPNGVRQLRVAVVGNVGNAPIQWIYYQLTHPSGQRATCAFTMSGENVDRFGTEDLSFVGGLTFAPPHDSGEPDQDDKNVAARTGDPIIQ